MLKNTIEAMEIIKATINELHQDDMKVITGEVKSIINNTLNKLNNNISVKTAAEIKGENINIIVSELNCIVQETFSNLGKNTVGECIDCRPVIICFVMKDAECVNIYNGACTTWKSYDYPEKSCEAIV
ncbi:MAG: hypothetical protein PHD36_07335 [Desulfotomaculaceae bacterium]|nr:hypothetical protein [Desulfotomaculaceae bacterium]